MGRKYKDNSLTTLAAGITAIAGTLTVVALTGDRFPPVVGRGAAGSAPDYFVITLEDSAGNIEKIRVEQRAAGVDVLGSGGYPLVRGYDGTVARAWLAGDLVDLRWERKGAQEVEDNIVPTALARAFGYKDSTTSGLNFGYYGCQLMVDGVRTTVADGVVALTGASTNYVERDSAGTVTANTAAFSADKFPMYEVVTDAGGISSVTERRTGHDVEYGRLSKSIAGGAGTTVLTQAEALAPIIELTGALTGNRVAQLPRIKRAWLIKNSTTGAFSVQVKGSAGTGPLMVRGQTDVVYCDGTDFFMARPAGVSAPAQVTADQNNYAIADGAAIVKVNTDANRKFTGIAGGTADRVITWVNNGAFIEWFTNEDAASNAENRLTGGTDVRLLPGEVAIFRYDTDSQRWRVIYTGLDAAGPEKDVASAATMLIGAAVSRDVKITGSTGPVTAFDVAPAGTIRRGRIETGLFQWTYHATNMPLPGGGNIWARPGDTFEIRSIGATWVFNYYERGDGSPVTGFDDREGGTGDVPINFVVLSAFNIVQNVDRWPVGYGQTTIGTAEVDFYVPEDCTCEGMAVNLNAAPAANITMTLRKERADTAQAVTLNGATQGTNNTAVHFRKGERWSVKCTAGALGVNTIDGTVTLRFVRYGTNQGMPCIWGAGLSGSNGLYGGMSLFVGSGGHTVQQALIATPEMAFMYPANGTGRHRNGTTAALVGLPVGGSNTDSPWDLAAGDTFQVTNLGGAPLSTGRLRNSRAYPVCPLYVGGSSQAQGTNRFLGGLGHLSDAANAISGSTVESEMEFIPPAGKAKGMYGHIDAQPTTAGHTVTVTLRKNGVDTGITIQFINGGAIIQSETATEVTFNGTTDKASFNSISTASTGTRFVKVLLGFYKA